MGKSGSVSCGVTAPFSWILMHARFCFCPPRVCFPRLCVSSGSSMMGLMVTSSKRAYAIPKSAAPSALSPRQSTADPYLHRRYSNTVLSQSLWGPWVLVWTRFVWALWASLAGMGFDSNHEFAPPTILLGLLLCPWTRGISSKPLQHLPSYWGFSDPRWCWWGSSWPVAILDTKWSSWRTLMMAFQIDPTAMLW